MEGHVFALELALLVAMGAWSTVTVVTVAGRLRYDRGRAATGRAPELENGSRRRLRRRARRHRGQTGKWRRISALRALARARDNRAPGLLRAALVDGDPDLAGAAVRAFGEMGGDWAVAQLIQALQSGAWSRSRIAAQLDTLLPDAGEQVAELVDDPDARVRYWAVTLLGRVPDLAIGKVIAHTLDDDPNVRAAAVESLAARGETSAGAAVRVRLSDDAWFGRVHACRALGRLGALEDAQWIAKQLRDERWWVRTAAKDALCDFGMAVAGVLVPYLHDADAFARNGAAEVLQDVGFLDALSRYGREGELGEQILAAGGESFRAAAAGRARAREERAPPKETEAS